VLQVATVLSHSSSLLIDNLTQLLLDDSTEVCSFNITVTSRWVLLVWLYVLFLVFFISSSLLLVQFLSTKSHNLLGRGLEAPFISDMAKARIVKICTPVGYIKSYQRDYILH